MDRPTPLTEREALVAYATMLNRADPSVLAPLLAEDFRLTSQQVLDDLVGKATFLEYMAGKFEAMRHAGVLPRADLARLPGYGHDEAVLIWQGEAPEPLVTVYADVADGRLAALHLCSIPSPRSGVTLGLWPGRDGGAA
jgi:hypothetical protein